MNFLFGVDRRRRINPRFRKKLLRFGASLSALAVIAPINFLWHLRLSGKNKKWVE